MLRISRLASILFLFCFTSLTFGQSSPSPFVKRAYVDETGHVHIVRANGRELRIAGEKDQVSTEELAVAPDGRTVGWLVNFPNCCTSYPVSLSLNLYRSGKIIKIHTGMMLYKWAFVNHGRQVALSTGTVHGMQGIELRLYDSRSGKLVKSWSGTYDDVPPQWGIDVAH